MASTAAKWQLAQTMAAAIAKQSDAVSELTKFISEIQMEESSSMPLDVPSGNLVLQTSVQKLLEYAEYPQAVETEEEAAADEEPDVVPEGIGIAVEADVDKTKPYMLWIDPVKKVKVWRRDTKANTKAFMKRGWIPVSSEVSYFSSKGKGRTKTGPATPI